jgi:hypothetical protein
VFAPQLPAQPNSRSALTRNPFNLQRHGSWVRYPQWLMQPLGHSEFAV